MDYHSMKRKELQALCKKHNIPANSANSVLADKLSQLLNEKQKPTARQRTCIKSSVENTDDGEPAVAKRQAKKVRFSPNDDLVEYEPGKKQTAMVTETKVQRKSAAEKADKSVINSNNTIDLIEDGAQVPVKLTRSKVQGKQAVNDVEKGTNVVKETEGNHGRATRSKAHTLGNTGAVQFDESMAKRAVKDVENLGNSVVETVVGRARVTRSKGQNVQNDEPSKEIMDIPARVPRSRGQTSKEDIRSTVNNPQDGKKRTRREMKLTDMGTNSSNVAPEDDQKLPKRKSLRTKGGENIKEDKGDELELVNESRVTRSKAPLTKKSSARNNKSKTVNKVEVQQPEEPLKPASKKNVNRRKSVVQPEKTEAVLHHEEPVNRRTRQTVARKQSKVQSGRVSVIDECSEIKENVATSSRRDASENETKTVSSASGSPQSRKRRGSVEVEYVSPVGESSKRSTRSERKLVAENQLESSSKTPVSMRNKSAVKYSRIRDNSSNKRAKLSGNELGDSESHDVKSNNDGTPVSKIASFELGKKITEAVITPVIDESSKRFTRSSIKDPSQPAIEEQPTGNARFSPRKVAKFKPDTVFSTAPGRITRSGIKHGRNSASNFDIKKQQSQSTRKKNHFGDVTEMFSPEVAEDRPNPDAPIEIQPKFSPKPDVSLEAPSEIRPNLVVPIEIQPESMPYLEVTETRPNPEMNLDVSSEIRPNPDMALEVQSETRPNPDVPIEVPNEIRPNSEVTLEVQSESEPNLDVMVVESETRSGPDVPIEVQSEIRSNPEVNLEVESEIQPNPDMAAEIESEIRHNPDLPTETCSENFEMYPVLKKSGDFLSSESVGLPTKVLEENQDGTGTAIVTESVCPVLGENRDSDAILNGSHSREKDVEGTPLDANISNLNMTPFSKAEVTEITPYAVPDGSIVQNQSLDVNFSLFGESDGQAAVNAETSVLSAGKQEVYEKEIELTEPVASTGKTVVIEENVDNSVEGADNKRDSVSYIGPSAAAFHSSFEQSDVKSKMKEVEVAYENDDIIDDSVGEHVELSTRKNITYEFAMDDVADDIIDSGKEPAEELEFEVVPSTGNDVQEIPILGESDGEDENIIVDEKNDTQDGDYVHEGLTSNDTPAVDEQYVGGEDSAPAKSDHEPEPVLIVSGDDLAADREPEHVLSVSGVDLAGDNVDSECAVDEKNDMQDGEFVHNDFAEDNTLELGDNVDSEYAVDERNDMQDGEFIHTGLTTDDSEENGMQDGEYIHKGSTSGGTLAMDEQYAGGDESVPIQNDREPELVSSVFGDDLAADNTLGLGDTEGERGVDEKNNMQNEEYVHTGLASYDTPDEQHVGGDASAPAENDHEREPVLSVFGDDVAAITVDARDESVLDINKDAVSNIFGDIYTSNDSGHEEDVLGTSELDECVNSKKSENVSCDTSNEPRQKEIEIATESDRDEQKVVTVDSDADAGKFIEDSSNFGVDHKSPTREESSSIVYRREESIIASVEHMGDTGDHGSVIMKEETPVGDKVLNWPEEDDINTQEENQNMNMDIDWGDYSFGMDEYQKSVSANESDEKVEDLEMDSGNVAEEKPNQEDILKEKANEDMTGDIFNWSAADSAVKYEISATTQISNVKEVGVDAVAHEYSHQMEIEQLKAFNKVGGSDNEMYGAAKFEDYTHRHYFGDEAGGSSDISGKKEDFEFKQYDLSIEAAGTSHGLNDDIIPGGELEKKEEIQLEGFSLETGDHDLAFDKGVRDM